MAQKICQELEESTDIEHDWKAYHREQARIVQEMGCMHIDLSTDTQKFVWLREPFKIRGHYGQRVWIDQDMLDGMDYEITENYDHFIKISLSDFLAHCNHYDEPEVY